MFWNGRDMDDPFGEWVELPEENQVFDSEYYRVNDYMRHVRLEHEIDCNTDPKKKLFIRLGPGNCYWKCLPHSKTIDIEYYAKEFNKPASEIIKMFKEDGFNMEAFTTGAQQATC